MYLHDKAEIVEKSRNGENRQFFCVEVVSSVNSLFINNLNIFIFKYN